MKALIIVCTWAILNFCLFLIDVKAEATTRTPTFSTGNTIQSSTTTVLPTTKPALTCEQRNASCDLCSQDIDCFWCGADSTCRSYDVSKIVPTGCKGNKWYWKQCVVPGYVLIIVVPVVAGLVLVTCCCCVYCCCCRTRGKKGYEREEERIRRRREDTRQKNQERREERKRKTDAIRQKYGLLSNADDEIV